MKRYIFIVGMGIFMQSVLADPQVIYKETDSHGNVLFSDKPSPGAQEIQLPPIQTFSSPPPTASEAKPENTPSSSPGADEPIKAYDAISIAQPEEQSTIRNPQGYVSVIVDLKPALKKGHKIQIILDGSPTVEPAATTVFALQNIKRGSHVLFAQVLDSNDKVIISSEQVNFYMMPPRVNMGQNGA